MYAITRRWMTQPVPGLILFRIAHTLYVVVSFLYVIASTEDGPPEGFPHRVQGSVRDWRVRPVILSIPSLSFHSDSILLCLAAYWVTRPWADASCLSMYGSGAVPLYLLFGRIASPATFGTFRIAHTLYVVVSFPHVLYYARVCYRVSGGRSPGGVSSSCPR